MRFQRAAVLSLAAAAIPAAAFALNHTTEYRTNVTNYRTCTSGLDATCVYSDTVSPSNYYLANGKKITVLHQSNGTVQVRIDANTIRPDQGLTFPCSTYDYPCGGSNTCVGGPYNGTGCNKTCVGGANAGGSCLVASACPGGSCTGPGDTCSAAQCDEGPQAGDLCVPPADEDCGEPNGSSGWELRFLGNRTSKDFVPLSLLNFYELLGNGVCEKRCPITLGSDGSFNDTVTCTTVGSCAVPGGATGIEAFHHVLLLDRSDIDYGSGPKQILGVPAVGDAVIQERGSYIGTWYDPGDPAKYGDCAAHSYAPGSPTCP